MEINDSLWYLLVVLAIIGGLWLLVVVAKLLWTLLRMLLPRKDLVYEYGSNTWAVVTGASDGIGLAFAKELARQSFNVCLIGRNPQKLANVQNGIKQLYPEISTRIVIADFVNSQQSGFFQRLGDELKTIDVSILVNNVGIANVDRFENISLERLIEQINVNCLPPACMTSVLVPRLLARQSRSAIINISSTASQVPTPYSSNYSGTKGFGAQLSRSLQLEYENKIDTLMVKPMVVESNLSRLGTDRFDVISPEQCAKASLDVLGYQRETNGHWKHRVLNWVIRTTPTFIVDYMSKLEMKKAMKQREKWVLSP